MSQERRTQKPGDRRNGVSPVHRAEPPFTEVTRARAPQTYGRCNKTKQETDKKKKRMDRKAKGEAEPASAPASTTAAADE